MNNGKYKTEQYKRLQSEKNDRLYGAIKQHNKICECCGNKFVWEGREKTKAFANAKFCSRSCANNRQKYWNKNATNYRTIALREWSHKCAICGFDKIIAIHHIDENKKNNNPENLIPLCPNHHEMVHSKWSYEVVPLIEEKINEKYGAVV